LWQLNANVPVMLRKFVSEVRRCEELERSLRYIEDEVRKDVVNIPQIGMIPKAPNPREMINLEVIGRTPEKYRSKHFAVTCTVKRES